MFTGLPFGKPYRPDDIIIVDPEQAGDAKNGDCVIALLLNEALCMERRVTFKQLVIDGPRTYLRPLDDRYEPLHEPFEVIGLVIDAVYGD